MSVLCGPEGGASTYQQAQKETVGERMKCLDTGQVEVPTYGMARDSLLQLPLPGEKEAGVQMSKLVFLDLALMLLALRIANHHLQGRK